MILKLKLRHVLLILLAALAGVVIYFLTNKKEALKFVLPEITKVTLIQSNIHDDTAHIDVFVIAENNSPYKMSIDSVVFDLSIGGEKVLSERQFIGLKQEKDQSDTVKLSVHIPMKHTMKTIRSLQSQDYTGLTIDATVVYNTIAGVKRISISKDKKIEVPIPPQLKVVTKTRDVKLFRRKADVDLYLQIINEGKNIDIELTDVNYKLIIGKDLDTKGKLSKKIIVKPRSETTVKFPLDFEMNRPVGTIFRVVTDTDRVPFDLELSGFLNAGKNLNHIPFVIFAKGKLEIVNEDKKAAEKDREKAQKKKERQEKRKK